MEKEVTEKVCENCRWVNRHEFEIALSGGPIASMFGFECCIRPPIHKDGFPKVRMDSWCGEFEEKEDND